MFGKRRNITTMSQLIPSEKSKNDNRRFLLLSCFFFISLFFADEGSANSADQCGGIIVKDFSLIEKDLSFTRPKISDDYDGYIAFFQVVTATGKVLSEGYDKEALRERALEYSDNQCAPEKIVYPDVQIVVELYEKGKIISRIEYENGGKILKRAMSYKPPGVLLAEYPYQNGKIEGPVKYYHESGKLNYELNYRDGKRHGCFESHYEGGKVKGVGCFTHDRLIGLYKFYHKNGDIEIATNYDSNGNLDGEYLEQYKAGKTKKKAFYKSGILEGEYKEWFKSGRVRVEAQYKNGKIIDKGYVYFEDGSISGLYPNLPKVKEWLWL
jgi:antitoxin component YwqK of YwqJK toxin-antitoxin module